MEMQINHAKHDYVSLSDHLLAILIVILSHGLPRDYVCLQFPTILQT